MNIIKINFMSIIIFYLLSACQISHLRNNNDSSTDEKISQNAYQELSEENEETPFPQPNLVFQTGSELISFVNCNEDLNGEIWFLEPPYEEANLILSNPEAAYLQPKWSPDGQWIAYWQSRVSNMPPEELDEVLWHFQEDSLWIMDVKGQEKHQLTDNFVRSNLMGFDNYCRTTGGILNLIGWSKNSEWLAFLISPEKSERIKPNLYLINIDSGELRDFSDIWSARWTPRSNILVGLNEQENTLEIIEVADSVSVSSIPFPEEIKAEHLPFDTNFVEGTDLLWVITRPRGNAYNTPRSLWLVDTSTNEWQLQSNIDLSDNFGGFDITEELALFCNRGDGSQRDIIYIWDYPTLEPSDQIEAHCDSTRLIFTANGNGWIGNFSSGVQKSIQISSLQSFSSKTLVNWENTNISNPRKVANFDWSLKNLQTDQ